MLTDRDIVTKALPCSGDLRNLAVDSVMTRQPLTISSQSSIDHALQRMRDGGVRRVPVVDDRGRLAGILALDDIFELMSHDLPFAATPIRREAHAP
jgi:CBS domain-containing protein